LVYSWERLLEARNSSKFVLPSLWRGWGRLINVSLAIINGDYFSLEFSV
jgi:hypothetical protein